LPTFLLPKFSFLGHGPRDTMFYNFLFSFQAHLCSKSMMINELFLIITHAYSCLCELDSHCSPRIWWCQHVLPVLTISLICCCSKISITYTFLCQSSIAKLRRLCDARLVSKNPPLKSPTLQIINRSTNAYIPSAPPSY